MRSPCPGTNTLANHGFINRNGLGISAQAYQQGFLDAFNLDFSVTQAGATNAINLCSSLTGTTCQAFDLWMLDTTHAIEHDGSLTRADRNETWNQDGNDYDFNTTVWGQTLATWGGATHIDLSLANSARLTRNAQQQAIDTPGWFVENDGGSLTEHGFYLSTMNDQTVSPGQDPNNPQARVDWIMHWFQQEELPTALGWVKPTQVISVDYVNAISSNVGVAPTVAPPAGAVSTEPSAVATADKRDLAAALADPTSSARVMSAAAQATQAAGPKPSTVNGYAQVLSPEDWASQQGAVAGYMARFSDAFDQLLDGIL